MIKIFHINVFLLTGLLLHSLTAAASFVAFESGHVRPLALSTDGTRLFAVNTPDNRLEIFQINGSSLTLTGSVPVGMEPVAVAARNNNEVWVVNHLSDSVSIVDVSSAQPKVIRTLLVGDEPRDIVFAGTDGDRAFITTAHRGQNSPYTDPLNPGEMTTEGIGRADVWVFNANELGPSLGGDELTIITLFGDTPRALTVSPDGTTVYAAVFHSGNQTTTIPEGAVCDGGATANACAVDGATAPGGLPAPNVNVDNVQQPEVSLIVKYNGTQWVDELNRDWSGLVRFNLPDYDVFQINADANPPVETNAYPGVGTILYNMAVNPLNGKVYVSNTEALNEVRFEGLRADNSISTVTGHQHESHISIIDPATSTVTKRHLNKHIDYSVVPSAAGVKEKSLALPRQMVFSSDGLKMYMVAKGSSKVGVFTTSTLDDDSFVPDSSNHIVVTGGGPSGLVLDESRNQLYVFSRFDNGISIVNTANTAEVFHTVLANPEPDHVKNGRPFLYDAFNTSSNGEASCGSCHVDGDMDDLAWDLGDPEGTVATNQLDFRLGPIGSPDFHPMKGPMTTQTFRGIKDSGSMHWRGDRSGGDDESNAQPDQGAYNEDLSFKKFNPAFVGLLGNDAALSVENLQAFTDFSLSLTPPPNPVRNLDNSLTSLQQAGETFYFNNIVDTQTCNACHVLDESQNFFGTDGRASFEAETQHLKIPHLRNLYAKVGMFGNPNVPFFNAIDSSHTGDQIRGFGFIHDGSTDTLFRFFNATVFFGFTSDTQRAQMEQFMLAFNSNLKPIVGQQVTLTDTNSANVDPRIDLLVSRAAAGDNDLIVKAVIGGNQKGWYRLPDGTFRSDVSSEVVLTETNLRALANVSGQQLTFTATPPGTGLRMGVDRDEDTFFDADDNCPAILNTDQLNTDSDSQGNACDADDDNDGLSDVEEADIGTNPLVADTDIDGVDDGVDAFPLNPDETLDTDLDGIGNNADTDDDNDGLLDVNDPLPLVFNYKDSDLAPLGAPDGVVNAADIIIAQRIVLGLITPGQLELTHGDVYPPAAPDGVINIQDMILIQQMAVQ